MAWFDADYDELDDLTAVMRQNKAKTSLFIKFIRKKIREKLEEKDIDLEIFRAREELEEEIERMEERRVRKKMKNLLEGSGKKKKLPRIL